MCLQILGGLKVESEMFSVAKAALTTFHARVKGALINKMLG